MGVFAACIVHAETINYTVEPPRPLFEMQTLKINEVDKDITEFNMGVTTNDKNAPIAYWKIRLYCDKGVTVSMAAKAENKCGKAVTHSTSTLTNFPLFFSNIGNNISNFNFKLKAYDSNGKWLSSEKKSFSWK